MENFRSRAKPEPKESLSTYQLEPLPTNLDPLASRLARDGRLTKTTLADFRLRMVTLVGYSAKFPATHDYVSR